MAKKIYTLVFHCSVVWTQAFEVEFKNLKMKVKIKSFRCIFNVASCAFNSAILSEFFQAPFVTISDEFSATYKIYSCGIDNRQTETTAV